MELEKLILSEDEVLKFVDTKARQDITNTNTNLNKKVDDYTKAVSSDFTALRSETDNTVRYLTSIITNHQDVTDEELGRIREELLNSIPKNLSDLVDDKGFLTHLPEELITEIELALALDSKGFIKLEEVLDKINILRQELKNYSDEKTQQHITDTDTKLATLNEVLLQYINNKNSDLTSYVDNLVSSSIKEIIPESLIDAKIEAAAEGHASTDYVDSKVRDATADKATITYVDNRVQSYVEDKVTIAEVNKKVNDAVANKATTSYVDTAVADAVKNKATEVFVTNYTDTKVADKATVTYVNSTVANAVSDKASVTYVDTKVAKLVGTTPETLDTLEEIANAIKTSDSILNTLNSAIGTKADKTTVDNILKSLPMKADQSYVEGLSNILSTKADKSELTSLSSLINNKADKSDLNILREELNNQISGEVIEELTTALELKANKTDIPTTVASLADAGEYVKFTDYATDSKAGIIKGSSTYGLGILADGMGYVISASETDIKNKTTSYRPITPNKLDYAIKLGLTTNALTWSETDKATARTLISAISNTDYATESSAGVHKVNPVYGTRLVNGVLDLLPAQYSEIDARTHNENPLYLVSNNTRHMIVPANFDYAFKRAFLDDKLKGTDKEWTTEEKTTAISWLGVVQKTTEGRQIYGTDTNGAQALYYIDYPNWGTVNGVPVRAANGAIHIPNASCEDGGSGSIAPTVGKIRFSNKTGRWRGTV